MGKSTTQKNNELIVKQQKAELAKLRETLPQESLRSAEDKLLQQCLETLDGLMGFADIGYTDTGELDEDSIPAAWAFLPKNERDKRIRLAKYACLPSSDIPHGAKMAHTMAIGIIKARATENSGSKVLNIEVSSFPVPAPLEKSPDAIEADFEVIELE